MYPWTAWLAARLVAIEYAMPQTPFMPATCTKKVGVSGCQLAALSMSYWCNNCAFVSLIPYCVKDSDICVIVVRGIDLSVFQRALSLLLCLFLYLGNFLCG